jgi:hypothetical protein
LYSNSGSKLLCVQRIQRNGFGANADLVRPWDWSGNGDLGEVAVGAGELVLQGGVGHVDDCSLMIFIDAET